MKTTTAADLMTGPVRRLTMHATARAAAEFMIRHDISGAPVLDGLDRPVGVLTMHDLAAHVRDRLVELPEVDPRRERIRETGESVPRAGFHFESLVDAPVTDLMTPGLVSVSPEAPVAEVVETMISLKIHRVFVMAPDGELLGVITTMDIMRWLAAQTASPARREDA